MDSRVVGVVERVVVSVDGSIDVDGVELEESGGVVLQ